MRVALTVALVITAFQYDRRPLVVWGYWSATHYSNSRFWIKTVYAIK